MNRIEMKEVLTLRLVMEATDISLPVILKTFMNGMSEKCWQLERELHVFSLYTCQLIYLSLHRVRRKQDRKCLF